MDLTRKSFFLILFLFFIPNASLADNFPSLKLKEPWRDVFAGQPAVFHVVPASTSLSSPTVVWRLTYNNRTLAQGTCRIDPDISEGLPAELSLAVPALQEGVVIQAELTVVHPETNSPVLLRETIHIFSPDAFSLKRQGLSDLKIGLYDPEKKTQAAFESIGLPFKQISNIDALPSFDGKLFIVGQNADLGPGTWEELRKLAQRNIPVLVLASPKGRLDLTDNAGNEAREPDRLVLSRQTIIREMDKTLDTHWPPQGRTVVSGVKIYSKEKAMYAEAGTSEEDWPWVEITFKNGGKMILCGFDFVGTAEQSPAPRYLLSHLIDYLVKPYLTKEAVK